MQNGTQIEPRTFKIHPLGNDFTPKMVPRWIQATLGAHGTTRSMPRSPWSPKRQPAWSQNLTQCTCSLTSAWNILICLSLFCTRYPVTRQVIKHLVCQTFKKTMNIWKLFYLKNAEHSSESLKMFLYPRASGLRPLAWPRRDARSANNFLWGCK